MSASDLFGRRRSYPDSFLVKGRRPTAHSNSQQGCLWPRASTTPRARRRKIYHQRYPTASLPLKRNGSSSAWHPFLLCSGKLKKKTCGTHTQTHPTRTCSPFTANIYFPVIPALSREFHKSIELINLTVTMYMVFQGICACITQSAIGTISYCSLPHKRTSSDALGNTVRPSRAQANYDLMSSNPDIILRRARPSPNLRLLALDALTVFPSSGISEHLRSWYVSE